jgi:hypothetical protein
MTKNPPMAEAFVSYSAALVLQAMAQGQRQGFEIMRATRLPATNPWAERASWSLTPYLVR